MATDPLDDMPKIRLEEDDLESFHRTRSQSANKRSKTDSLPDDSPSASNSPSWFSILFLLAVIIGTTGYWSYKQFKVLQQAQSRITELESRLSATGENMDQSAAALQVKVSELSKKTEHLWSEMDKLWASAWRRNQSEIGDLNKIVVALKASSEKSIKNLSNETTDNDATIGIIKEQFASLREKLISTALANNDLTNQIDDLRRRVIAAEKKASEVKVIPAPGITPL
jgi:uncharacterized coiled-coil protein SlyX